MDARLIRWALAVLLLAVWPLSAVAQSPKTGVVTALQGRATVARALLPQPASLKFKDDIFVRDRIGTGERSIVRILFGGKALVTVRERSVLTVTEEPNRHIVGVQDGKLALNLAKSLVRPGEVVEVRTPNAIVGIRGSFVVVETRLVSGVRQTDVTAVHVSTPVIVSSPIDPKLSVAITSGQTVSVRGLGATIVMAPARAITPEETTAATRAGEVPLSASRPIAPTVDQTRALATGQLEQAVALADSLLRVTGGVTGQVTGSAGATVRATGGVGGVTGSALPGVTTTTQTAGGAVASTLSGTISGTTSTLTNAISAINATSAVQKLKLP